MKLVLITCCLALLLVSFSSAQRSRYAGSQDLGRLPVVHIDHHTTRLQQSLFPDLYNKRSARRDTRWVQQNDSTIILLWQVAGDSILAIMTRLAGIDWVETSITVHLVRFFPTMGAASPAIIPVGGIRRGILTEAAPSGASMKLNLIYQFAQRCLAQVYLQPDSLSLALKGHPLMQPTPYRRDNLAMLLALVTAQQVMGLDSTYSAYQSAFWKERMPGGEILQEYLLSEWILSPEHPLAQWIVEEPYTSRLVSLTRPPKVNRLPRSTGPRAWVEGLPIAGRLGFSVKPNEAGQLTVDKIDLYRLAFASGLREADVIRRVNGVRPRNHKDLIERILDTLDDGGAVLQVTREGQQETVILQPVDLPAYDDGDYWESFYDSTTIDTLLPEAPVPVEDSLRQP